MVSESHHRFGNGPEMDIGYISHESLQVMPGGTEFSIVPTFEPADETAPMPGPEWQAARAQKLVEIRDNWQIIRDEGRTFEVTIANKGAMKNENGVMVRVSPYTVTEDLHEAVELADDAIQNPDMPIIHIVMPGRGGSTGLTQPELEKARRSGLFVGWDKMPDDERRISYYDPIPSVKSMAQALDGVKGTQNTITRLSASDKAAHFASVLMSALPDVERAVLTNPTNLSDMNAHIADYLGWGHDLGYLSRHRPKLAEEMAEVWEYEEASKDPLSITTEHLDEAARIMGEDFIKEAQRTRVDLSVQTGSRGEARIFMKGLGKGAAAVHHIIAGLCQNPDAIVTYIFPDRSSNYKGRYEIFNFIEAIYETWVKDQEKTKAPDVKGILVPPGQFWSRYHPMGRLALEREAFSR